MRQLGGGHNSTILPQFQSGGRPARARSTEDRYDILRLAAREKNIYFYGGPSPYGYFRPW